MNTFRHFEMKFMLFEIFMQHVVNIFGPIMQQQEQHRNIINKRMSLLHAISHMGHCLDGTHKLLDPVSKTTLKVWPGVPRSMGP